MSPLNRRADPTEQLGPPTIIVTMSARIDSFTVRDKDGDCSEVYCTVLCSTNDPVAMQWLCGSLGGGSLASDC